MVLSVSVLTGFDSLSRFTDTSLLRTVCFIPEERKPLQFVYHLMHAKFIKKMFLSRFTLHPSLFSFLIPRNDSFMKVIDV